MSKLEKPKDSIRRMHTGARGKENTTFGTRGKGFRRRTNDDCSLDLRETSPTGKPRQLGLGSTCTQLFCVLENLGTRELQWWESRISDEHDTTANEIQDRSDVSPTNSVVRPAIEMISIFVVSGGTMRRVGCDFCRVVSCCAVFCRRYVTPALRPNVSYSPLASSPQLSCSLPVKDSLEHEYGTAPERKGGGNGRSRENPPTNGIVRNDPQMRKPGAVHDKVTTFEINLRKKSLPLPTNILKGALSDTCPLKWVTMDGKYRANPYEKIQTTGPLLKASSCQKQKVSGPLLPTVAHWWCQHVWCTVGNAEANRLWADCEVWPKCGQQQEATIVCGCITVAAGALHLILIMETGCGPLVYKHICTSGPTDFCYSGRLARSGDGMLEACNSVTFIARAVLDLKRRKIAPGAPPDWRMNCVAEVRYKTRDLKLFGYFVAVFKHEKFSSSHLSSKSYFLGVNMAKTAFGGDGVTLCARLSPLIAPASLFILLEKARGKEISRDICDVGFAEEGVVQRTRTAAVSMEVLDDGVAATAHLLQDFSPDFFQLRMSRPIVCVGRRIMNGKSYIVGIDCSRGAQANLTDATFPRPRGARRVYARGRVAGGGMTKGSTGEGGGGGVTSASPRWLAVSQVVCKPVSRETPICRHVCRIVERIVRRPSRAEQLNLMTYREGTVYCFCFMVQNTNSVRSCAETGFTNLLCITPGGYQEIGYNAMPMILDNPAPGDFKAIISIIKHNYECELISATINLRSSEPMRVKRSEAGAAPECTGGRNGRSPKKTHRPAVSSGTNPTSENPGETPPGIEPGSPSVKRGECGAVPGRKAGGGTGDPPENPTNNGFARHAIAGGEHITGSGRATQDCFSIAIGLERTGPRLPPPPPP
ncbi:hypothetical protein PR048_024697 [Dryococelus australis]|uniref:Uncharacterized protein n=1 Tax=Dryococelus australis TaxID=614101 RepID=A0ABQ9GPD6_9NEOP|nr:hypothetical protein PR048_024697 [Dryococelus australis]